LEANPHVEAEVSPLALAPRGVICNRIRGFEYQVGFNGFKYNPVDYAAAVRCPSLFLHGAGDPRAHLEEARQVFAAVPGPAPKHFREFAGLGHEPALSRFPDQWKEAITSFLAEIEKTEPGPAK
jgi:pimeloyl-ACP methyl ester carboxylesterase